MHVVPNETQSNTETTHELRIAGVPMGVVFAEGEEIARVAEMGTGTLSLDPPFHVAPEDTYLVLPSDIGMEIVDIMRDSDLDLLHEAMRDGLVACGPIVKGRKGAMTLHVHDAVTPSDALSAGIPYAATIPIGPAVDPLAAMRKIPHLSCNVRGALCDDEGLDRMLRKQEYVGLSFLPTLGEHESVEPSFVWSKRLSSEGDAVGVEFALFTEYEELVALLRPLLLVNTR
jgi:hypothetical protein